MPEKIVLVSAKVLLIVLLFVFARAETGAEAEGWSDLPPAETVACSGMARAAEWLHREVREWAHRASSRLGYDACNLTFHSFLVCTCGSADTA